MSESQPAPSFALQLESLKQSVRKLGWPTDPHPGEACVPLVDLRWRNDVAARAVRIRKQEGWPVEVQLIERRGIVGDALLSEPYWFPTAVQLDDLRRWLDEAAWPSWIRRTP